MRQSIPADNLKHISAMDGWRGLAVLLVVVWHYGQHGYAKPPPWITVGWTGVDLFFVLSGFLITRILLATKGKARYFRNFYARRSLRIFPLYYAVLIFVYLAWPLLHRDRPHIGDVLPFASYLSNYVMPLHPNGLPVPKPFNVGHFWSLAVEEQFYLLWPAVVLALSAISLYRVSVGVVCASWVLRCGAALSGIDWQWSYLPTPCHMDGLAIGGLLALMESGSLKLDHRPIRYIFIGTGLSLIVLFSCCGGIDLTAHRTVLALAPGLAAVLYGTMLWHTLVYNGGLAAAFLRFAPLRWFGRYSYGLYVFHGLLARSTERLFERSAARVHFHAHPFVKSLAFIVFGAAVSTVVAVASYHLLEQPFLKLKKLFGPRPLVREAVAT